MLRVKCCVLRVTWDNEDGGVETVSPIQVPVESGGDDDDDDNGDDDDNDNDNDNDNDDDDDDDNDHDHDITTIINVWFY